MEQLLKKLNELPELRETVASLESGKSPVAVSGLQSAHRAAIGAAIAHAMGRPSVFLCGDEQEVKRLSGDLHALTGAEPVTLLGREWQFRAGAVSSRAWEQNRLAALYALAKGKAPVCIATADALMARAMPKKQLSAAVRTLKVSGKLDLNELAGQLTAAGYFRCEQVEGVGQFAVRGGILDVFSPLMESPVRCELFDDEIDSMGTFDPASQRRTKNIKSALLLPAAEVLPHQANGGIEGLAATLDKEAEKLEKKGRAAGAAETLCTDAQRLRNGENLGGADRYLCAVYPEAAWGLDFLPADAVVFLSETARVEERVKGFALQVRQDTEALLEAGVLTGTFSRLSLTGEEFFSHLAEFPTVMETSLPTSRYPMSPKHLVNLTTKQLPSYGGSLETAAEDLKHYRTAEYGVLILCGGEARAKNLLRLLEERDIPATLDLKNAAMPAPGEVRLTAGALSAGSEWPQLHLAVLTEGQLTPTARKRQKLKKDSSRQKLQSFTDLSPGDLVVHTQHGVGRFAGLRKMPVDGVEKDYIKIDYAAGDCLYVPVTALDQVSKYIGSGEDGGEHQRLNKLGGTEWARSKTKAKAAAKDLAKGLIALYAQRQKQPGFAFSPDSPWQQEFEDAFPYPETGDQLRAVEEIKADMEQARPMDRLLCGDVGYGKTEVALRGVMKCVLDGKQAAILVPTTILAQQHYATAMSRFAGFPVNVEVLSRFTTPKEQKRILEATRTGGVDVLIGTHKLLQKSVQFKDLGLLVIDEEQRFGVTHKERLKEMAKQVDTLTLSATPIPRTLNMALSGLRDMSTIEEPPADRQPVQTYVLEHDWEVLADAIRRELSRGGQVYYLHNRVESISTTAGRLQKLLGPEARIVIGHGKMSEQELSDVMGRMVDGEADILVCTTIIETGIDISNVNTLVIEDADRMGLAQLHQIRGRIGRSTRRAYAYLTYRPGKILQETASKRLGAIREYVEFGSGFKIAMRDLEIRGAGNLLGPEQSGYLMSVGYDMYLKLLNEAVAMMKGEAPENPVEECTVDMQVQAHIPESYIDSTALRLDVYRRIADIKTYEDSSDVVDELIDRFGEPPESVYGLIDIALLRNRATQLGITEVKQQANALLLYKDKFDMERVKRLIQGMPNKVMLSAGSRPYISVALGGKAPLTVLEDVLKVLCGDEDAKAPKPATK